MRKLHVHAAVLALSCASASAEVVVLRSGNGPVGGPDTSISFIESAPTEPVRNAVFQSADFAAACTGPAASVVAPHALWLTPLPSDPLSRWIGVDAQSTPNSALYCHPFRLEGSALCSASLSMAAATDDMLGDPGFDPNPVGLYLNGTPLDGFQGGHFDRESVFQAADVAGLLLPGSNLVHVYQRDMAAIAAGVVYSVTISITRPPLAEAGPDRTECEEDEVTLVGGGSSEPPCAELEYRWLEGATLLRDWDTDPTLSLVAVQSMLLTLQVRCSAEPGCTSSDEMVLTAEPCQLAVDYVSYAALRETGGVRVTWKTSFESDTFGFEVWARDGGMRSHRLPGLVFARGAGSSYEYLDSDVSRRYTAYRVVERTFGARGYATPWFDVIEPRGLKRERELASPRR